MRLTHWLHPLRRTVTSTSYPALNYINNFFDSGVQAKPKSKSEEPAAPAPEAPAQDAGVQPSVAPAPDEVQEAQPGGKKTVIVPICLNRTQPPSWTF